MNQWQCAALCWAMIVLAAMLSALGGCSESLPNAVAEFHAPETFTDRAGNWELVDQPLSEVDVKRIESFFQTNQELLGSPDWTGNPSKYLLDSGKSKVRFYWFSGDSQCLTWNAIEFKGVNARQLSGAGLPGS